MGGAWHGRHFRNTGRRLLRFIAINPAARNGLFYGRGAQVLIQLAGIAAVWAFAFAMTWGLGKLVDVTMGLRVSATEESVGLDISQHGERAYGGQLR